MTEPFEPATTTHAKVAKKLLPALALVIVAAATFVGIRFFRSVLPPLYALGVVAVVLLAFGRRGRRALEYVFGGWVLGLVVALVLALAPPPADPIGHGDVYCMTHLRNIGIAVALYRMENNDAYPPDLDALIAAHHIGPRDLRCPVDANPDDVDYFYIPPDTPRDAPPPDTALLACDLRKNHPGWRNVVFHDTKVERLDEADFQALLARGENAAFAAALRAAEGP